MLHETRKGTNDERLAINGDLNSVESVTLAVESNVLDTEIILGDWHELIVAGNRTVTSKHPCA